MSYLVERSAGKPWYCASPSELVLADDCSRAHDFRCRQKLRRVGDRRSPTLASGSAVATAVERLLWDMSSVENPKERLSELVKAALAEEFAGDEEAPKLMKKFLPGVKRAVSRLPDWFWQGTWLVEHDVYGVFENDDLGIRVEGRADMVRLVDEPVPTVELIDVKTTDTDPMEYVLWSPQLRIYAACLQQMYPDRLVVYRYVCVPTGVSAVAKPGAEFVFTNVAEARAREEILRYAMKLQHDGTPRYARRCAWCSYAPICTAIVTGADPAGIIQEMYVRKVGSELAVGKDGLGDAADAIQGA